MFARLNTATLTSALQQIFTNFLILVNDLNHMSCECFSAIFYLIQKYNCLKWRINFQFVYFDNETL